MADNALVEIMTPIFKPKENSTFDSMSVETTASFLGSARSPSGAVEMLDVDWT